MDLDSLCKMSYGMYVVCSAHEGVRCGQVANVVFQVTAEPPKIATSISKENQTHEMIQKSGVFSVSILSEDAPMEFIGKFGYTSGKTCPKFEHTDFRDGMTGAPIVHDFGVAFAEARVTETLDVGTHTIFVGEVVDAGQFGEGKPMTYAYYQDVKHGRSPEKAPTHR